MNEFKQCPKCNKSLIVKAGIVQHKQRYKCKTCFYHFTSEKSTKAIQFDKVVTCLQLYLCGLSYREIEAITSVSHVSVMNWVKKYEVDRKGQKGDRNNFKIVKFEELNILLNNPQYLKEQKLFISPLNDKFILYELET